MSETRQSIKLTVALVALLLLEQASAAMRWVSGRLTAAAHRIEVWASERDSERSGTGK
jgi:hypothetical protein